MPRTKPLAALLALLAIVAALTGCGSDDVNGTIPQADAQELISDLDAVETASADGDCATAEARIQDFVDHVNELPAPSGTALKDALRGAADNLQELVNNPCATGATSPAGQQPTNDSNTTAEETTSSTTTSSSTATSTTEDEGQPPAEPPADGNQNGGAGNGQPGGGAPPGGGQSGGDGTGGGVGGGTGGTGAG